MVTAILASPYDTAPEALERPSRLYFTNSVGSILAHPQGYVIVRYFDGPRQLDHLQAFLAHASQLLRSRGWHKLLSDQRRMVTFTPDEQRWMVEHWLTRPQLEGRQVHTALLVSSEDLAFPSLRQLHEGYAEIMDYQLFEDENLATAWLNQLG